MVISGINTKPKKFKVAVFENCVGIEALRIVYSMKFGPTESRGTLDDVMRKFKAIIVGQQKEFFHRFKFNMRGQENYETDEQYMAVLRNMAKSCGFCECMHDKLLIDRLIMGIKQENIRANLISQIKLDLSSAVEICKAMEVANVHLQEIRKTEEVTF